MHAGEAYRQDAIGENIFTKAMNLIEQSNVWNVAANIRTELNSIHALSDVYWRRLSAGYYRWEYLYYVNELNMIAYMLSAMDAGDAYRQHTIGENIYTR